LCFLSPTLLWLISTGHLFLPYLRRASVSRARPLGVRAEIAPSEMLEVQRKEHARDHPQQPSLKPRGSRGSGRIESLSDGGPCKSQAVGSKLRRMQAYDGHEERRRRNQFYDYFLFGKTS